MAYGLYDGTLNSLPGLGGYLQQKQLNEQQTGQDLQHATGAMSLLSAIQQQQQQAQLKAALASGADIESLIPKLVQSGNIQGASTLAQIAKEMQATKQAKATADIMGGIAGGSDAASDPEKLRKLGLLLGKPELITHAERIQADRDAAAQLPILQGTQGGLTAGQQVPGTKQVVVPGQSVPPEDMQAFLKVAQGGGTAAPQPGDVSPIQTGGSLNMLVASKNSAIAEGAKNLLAMVNSPTFKPTAASIKMVTDEQNKLLAQEAGFAQQRSMEGLKQDNKPDGPKYSNVQKGENGDWYGLNKENGVMEKIPAADGVKSSTGSLGSRESVFINRVILSGNEAAKDLANVVRLPMTASRGLFGGRGQDTGLLNAGKETLANTMTSQEVQSYNVMATGFQRSLAAIEASGLTPGLNLTHQMDSVIFKEGDTNLTKLQKLAQTRQIVEAGLESIGANPRVPEETKAHMKDILARIEKAVPFTQGDLIDLQQKQAIDPNSTLKDVIGMKPSAGSTWTPEKENRYQELLKKKNGAQ